MNSKNFETIYNYDEKPDDFADAIETLQPGDLAILFKEPKERTELEEIDYEDVFNILFNPNEINFHETSFTDLCNEIQKLLDNKKCVDLYGTIIKSDDEELKHFSAIFYNKQAFHIWVNNLSLSSDTEEWKFTGSIKYDDFGLKLVQRSPRGRGINDEYKINEYKGNLCYIPTEDFCFIKCINYLFNCNEEQSEENFEKFNQFLYKEKQTSRNGTMSNCKFRQYNEYFNLQVQYYNPKDRHLYPKGYRTPYNAVFYLHYPEGSKIGHYCLIHKDYKNESIQEINDNFTKIYKTVEEQNLKTLPFKEVKSKEFNYKNVYVWDLETHPDPRNPSQHPWPYALGAINLNKFMTGLPKTHLKEINEKLSKDLIELKKLEDGDPQENEDKIKELNNKIKEYNCLTDNELNKLKSYVLVFIGRDCITQFFNFLGQSNQTDYTLIAHNSSGFDSYFPIKDGFEIKEKGLLKTSRGILNARINNYLLSETVKKNIRKKVNEERKRKGWKVLERGAKISQTINLKCSYQHVKTSLSKWCNNFKLPSNICKMNYEIDQITHDNFMEKENESIVDGQLIPGWKPYLINDVLSLAFCIYKYNNVMSDLVDEDITTHLTSSGVTFNGWRKHLQKDNIPLHSHVDLWTRKYIRKSIKGGRVSANIQRFKSNNCSKIIKVLQSHLNTSNESLLCNVSFAESLVELVQMYLKLKDKEHKTNEEKLHDKIVSKRIEDELKGHISNSNYPTKLESQGEYLMAFDATSLYPSAMYDISSEYPKAESARKFKKEEEQEILNKFNTQTFRPKTGIFTVLFKYPNDMFFQPIPAKDTIQNHEGKKQEIIRFRNGYCYDVLNSVDIQEIVRCGGEICNIYDGIIYEENYDASPFRSYIEMLFNLRKKFKEEGNKVGDELIKLLMNSLYGKTVQKDITTLNHIWNENTLKNNFDESVKHFEKINDNQYLIKKEMTDDEFLKKNIITRKFLEKEQVKKIDETSLIEQSSQTTSLIEQSSQTTSLMPSHLGSFILAHSRRIMNNFILEIDGFKEKHIYYTDTDSIYISNELFSKLEEAGYVGGNLGQGKNDYGIGGIFYGLFIAPKVKYCLIIDKYGRLSEKKTFKGYNNDKVKVDDYIKLLAGETLETEVKRPWKRSIENGIEIPTEENKFVIKNFSSKINLLKRQAPYENYIMYPYDDTCVIQDIYNKITKENNLLIESDEEECINEAYIDSCSDRFADEENDIEND